MATMNTTYKFHCSCGQRYRATPKLAGREFSCMRCKSRLVVPPPPSYAEAVTTMAPSPTPPSPAPTDNKVKSPGLGSSSGSFPRRPGGYPTQEVETCLVASASALISRRVNSERKKTDSAKYEIYTPPPGLAQALKAVEQLEDKSRA